VVVNTQFVTSKFGDESLFFKHQWMEEDFTQRPQWLETIKSRGNLKEVAGTDDCSTEKPNQTCD